MYRRGIAAALLATATLMGAMGQAQDSAPATIGLNLPLGQSFIVEHRDQRRLPDGGMAQFHQQLSLSFAGEAGNVIATYQPVAHRCDGPVAICAAFFRQADMLPRLAVRFRIDATGGIAALNSPAPATGAADDTTAQVTLAVSAHEQAAPGAVMAADLRLLIRFATLALPAAGHSVAVTEGRLAVAGATAEVLILRIDRLQAPDDAMGLSGRVECRVTRATGLVERCRFTDWLGGAGDDPLRVRDIIVTPAIGPVS